MAKQSEFKEWQLEATWELDHEKGNARFRIFRKRLKANVMEKELLKEVSFVQGFYVDENGKFLAGNELMMMTGLLATLMNDDRLNSYIDRSEPSKERGPKHMGMGIYVHQQFDPKDLVKGDTFDDADFGMVEWDGKEWQQIKS